MTHFVAGLRRADCHISQLTALEIRSAIRRKESAYETTHDDAEQAISSLEREIRFYTLHPVDSAMLFASQATIDRHRLRALDAIQLSTALSLPLSDAQPLIFVAADKALLQAATNSGLLTLNPEDLPQP